MSAILASAASPAGWPWVSLYCLKWSTSANSTENGRRSRRERCASLASAPPRQGLADLPSVRPLVHHDLALPIQERSRRRLRKSRPHQIRGADSGPDDQFALVRD